MRQWLVVNGKECKKKSQEKEEGSCGIYFTGLKETHG